MCRLENVEYRSNILKLNIFFYSNNCKLKSICVFSGVDCGVFEDDDFDEEDSFLDPPKLEPGSPRKGCRECIVKYYNGLLA